MSATHPLPVTAAGGGPVRAHGPRRPRAARGAARGGPDRRRAGRLHRRLARRGLRGRLRRLLRGRRGRRRLLGHRGARARAARAGHRPRRRGHRAGELVHRDGRGRQPGGRHAPPRRRRPGHRPDHGRHRPGRARRAKVRCVIPVHLYGATVDMDPILEVAADARHRRPRGRVPGARRPLPRPPRRDAGRRGLLQLLPGQEPRRLGRRRGRRHRRGRSWPSACACCARTASARATATAWWAPRRAWTRCRRRSCA